MFEAFHVHPSYVECNQISIYMLFTLRLNRMDVFNCCERNWAWSLIVFHSSFTLQGYTALHIAMQFGRNDIFELLCNVYSEYPPSSIFLLHNLQSFNSFSNRLWLQRNRKNCLLILILIFIQMKSNRSFFFIFFVKWQFLWY